MRVLICGGRNWRDADAIRAVIAPLPIGSVIIHGGSPGADRIAGEIAVNLGFPVSPYYAQWHVHPPGWCKCNGTRRDYCPAAGNYRNARMLTEGKPDLVHAFPGPDSRGTWDMIKRARAAGVPVNVHLAPVESQPPR